MVCTAVSLEQIGHLEPSLISSGNDQVHSLKVLPVPPGQTPASHTIKGTYPGSHFWRHLEGGLRVWESIAQISAEAPVQQNLQGCQLCPGIVDFPPWRSPSGTHQLLIWYPDARQDTLLDWEPQGAPELWLSWGHWEWLKTLHRRKVKHRVTLPESQLSCDSKLGAEKEQDVLRAQSHLCRAWSSARADCLEGSYSFVLQSLEQCKNRMC
jgi:hypothetical protein